MSTTGTADEASAATGTAEAAATPGFTVDASRGFPQWLDRFDTTIAVTTYQIGKLILFGVKPDGRLRIFNRNIGRCLGMAGDGEGFWVASGFNFHRFSNLAARPGPELAEGDALFVPRLTYYTGDVDAHDVGIDRDGRPIFVNTLFNCLARPSATGSFEPIWKPSFITRLAAEDRCHLNGLAMVDGEPGYVTAVSETDVFDGWRDRRRDGGVVIDVRMDETVCGGLSMPHSPRWHDGRLWLHNSGTGEFGFIDSAGHFEPVTFCPGYLRGLSFMGGYAVAGLSLPRDSRTFSGLTLDDRLSQQGVEPKCAVWFIDLQSGDVAHALTFGGMIAELYDVVALPGFKNPAMLGVSDPANARLIELP